MKQTKYLFMIGFDTHILGILRLAAFAVSHIPFAHIPRLSTSLAILSSATWIPLAKADITVTDSRAWGRSSASASWHVGPNINSLGSDQNELSRPSGGAGQWSRWTATSPNGGRPATGRAGYSVYAKATVVPERTQATFELFGIGMGAAWGEGDLGPKNSDPLDDGYAVSIAGAFTPSCYIRFTLSRPTTFRLRGGYTAANLPTGGTGVGSMQLDGPSGIIARYYISTAGTVIRTDPAVATLAAGNYQLSVGGSGAADGNDSVGQFGGGGGTVRLEVFEIPSPPPGGDSDSLMLMTSETDVQEFSDINQAVADWFPVARQGTQLTLSGGPPELRFPSTAGLSYAVDWSDNLADWNRIEIRLTQDGETEEVLQDTTLSPSDTRRFYKVTPYLPILETDDVLIQP